MAELTVQRKKPNLFAWIMLLLGVLALIFAVMRGCGRTRDAGATTDSSATTWNGINFNVPPAAYSEITDTNINVRGGDNYAIYGLGENVLFNEGKSTLSPGAEQNLKQIAASINQRYKAGKVRVYGYTDAIGNANDNKELAQQRAQAVSDWLTANGSIDKNDISLEPVGEERPVASNSTSEGRKQNRRVEIVARK